MYFEPNTQSSHAYKKVQQNEYKKAKTGNSPTEWTVYQMKDLYTERKEPGNEELPVLSVSIHDGISDDELDEDELGKKIRRIADKSEYKQVKPGDLVFNMMRAWQGAIGVVKAEGMVSPAYIVATPNDKVYPPFMDYYMKTPRMIGIINRQSYGVTDFRKRLYWDSFSPISCAIPSIVEQQRISEILTLQDRIIELKEKLITEKQQQKKYLMQQLLTGKKRFLKFTYDWEYMPFSEIFSFLPTNTLARDSLSTNTGSVLNIHYGDILTKYPEVLKVADAQVPYVKPEAQATITACVKDGDLIIADTAEDLTVGKAVEIQDSKGKSIASGLHTILCRPRKDLFVSGWLGYYINSYAYRKQLLPLICGIKVSSISKKEIIKTIIAVPNKEEQKAIVDVFSVIDAELVLLQKELAHEKQKKKALMQLLLTGIVRVNK